MCDQTNPTEAMMNQPWQGDDEDDDERDREQRLLEVERAEVAELYERNSDADT